MKKYFIAIKAPEKVQAELAPVVKKLRISADRHELSVRWTPPELYHITIQFLGSQSAAELQVITEKFRNFQPGFKTVEIELDGMSGFSEESHARVVFVKVRRTKELLSLQEQLEKLTGMLAEQEFVPHLTLARLRNPTDIKDLISPFVRKDWGKWQANKLGLFSSEVQGPHVIHKLVAEINLVQ